MRRLLLCVVILGVAVTLSEAQDSTGASRELKNNPRAVEILDKVLAQYRSISTFYSEVRQTDATWSEWFVTHEVRIWQETRKRPNRMWLETVFPQERDLTPAERMLREGEPPKEGDESPLRYRLVACDGEQCWSEYFSLVAAQTPVGKGQSDTESMACQSPAVLHELKEGDRWPSDPPPDAPITVAELMDGADIRQRIVDGTIQLVTHSDDAGAELDTENVWCVRRDSGEWRPCYHIVFLLTNGLEQHYWVDVESWMLRAEYIVRFLPPAPDPFQDPRPRVQLPTDFSQSMLDRVQRVRRYMTGMLVKTTLYYDHLQWDFEIDDGAFDYDPSGLEVGVVFANKLYGALAKVYEITSGQPAPKEPPPQERRGNQPLAP